jgi:hypothetical protein
MTRVPAGHPFLEALRAKGVRFNPKRGERQQAEAGRSAHGAGHVLRFRVAVRGVAPRLPRGG